MCLVSCRPIKHLDEAICAVAPVQALPGMVGSLCPSLLFSKRGHLSFKNYMSKAGQVLDPGLALGYLGMKEQVIALLGCTAESSCFQEAVTRGGGEDKDRCGSWKRMTSGHVPSPGRKEPRQEGVLAQISG